MIRLGWLGAGRHARREHFPALLDYMRRHPGRVEPFVLCDPLGGEVPGVGFPHCCRSVDALLKHGPDAVVAVTPVAVTAATACRIVEAGIPLLMEKPLGVNAEEMKRVVATAEGRPVMVGMNRRFDPALVAAKEWLAGREISSVRAVMVRKGREVAGFVEDAGLHAIDAVRYLGGEFERVDGLEVRFRNGASGGFTFIPDGGHWEESYRIEGPGYGVHIEATCRAVVREAGTERALYERPDGLPGYAAIGTYGETVGFIESLLGRRPWSPSPAEVLAGNLVCLEMERSFLTGCGPRSGSIPDCRDDLQPAREEFAARSKSP